MSRGGLRSVALATLILLAGGATAAGDEPVVFSGATVIDGTGRPPVADAAVVIRGDRIEAMGAAAAVAIPTGARVIELAGKWIIPGLVDAHVHFFQSGGLYTRPDIIDLRAVRPYEEEIRRLKARLAETFARYLASGVTSVVDVGGPMWNFRVRERARATIRAPRVAVAGPLLATYAPPALAGADPPIIRITSPAHGRAEVRRQTARDVDLIKIWFVDPGRDLAGEMEWVRAVIDESHAAGVPVMVHATRRRLARAVVEAGADMLAHSIDDRVVDDELLQLMRRRQVIYVTTMMVHEGYREVFTQAVELSAIERRFGDPSAIASFADLATLPRHLLPNWVGRRHPPASNPVIGRNLRRVSRAGITVAAGSDAGNIGTLHGPALHRELELMAADGGLEPLAVLSAATLGGARVMGRAHELGSVEPGKLADMVILDADPLADIRNTRRIYRVVKGGVILDPAALIPAAGKSESG